MKLKIDLKILFFLGLFLITGQIKMYILIMCIALLHELAHILFGKILNFKIQEIELMPFGFWSSMQPNYEDYNKKFMKSSIVELKKILVAIAGPFLNLIFMIIFIKLDKMVIVYANLVILLVNLIPIYPLDGGRILNSTLRLIVNKTKADKVVNIVANILAIIITICGSIMILYIKNIAILLFLLYLWDLVISENKRYELKKKIYQLS